MKSLMIHEFATRQSLLRESVEIHREWIEKILTVPLSETVFLQVDLPIAEVAVAWITGHLNEHGRSKKTVTKLLPRVESIDTPPYYPPILEAGKSWSDDDSWARFPPGEGAETYHLDWRDCPVAIKLRGARAVIAVNFSYHAGPDSQSESSDKILIVSRQGVPAIMELLHNLSQKAGGPRVHMHHGTSKPIAKWGWDDLVLESRIVSLLKNDFETFFQREEWFRRQRLPFRRGYLLHGAPGNGKTSAIRAMMNSRSIDAYTLRLFDQNLDDSDLDHMFGEASKHRPSIVLLEDIDRAFPSTGELRCKASLQQLLNCLDGIATQDGVIVVATANEPTSLDAAILRRPGRFDRVIHFPNPDAELRREYFCKMNYAFESDDLDAAVIASSDFSFAQLREAYILAGQWSFEDQSEITSDGLLRGIESLRTGFAQALERKHIKGFRSACFSEVIT